MKRIISSIIVLVIICALCHAVSENSFMQSQDISFTVWSADSFAWNEDGLYIAHGIWTEDDMESWTPTGYNILKIQNGTEQIIELYSRIPCFPLYLMQDEGEIYIITVYYDFEQTNDCFAEIRVSQLDDLENPILVCGVDNRVVDLLLFKGNLYVATSDKLYTINNSGVLRCLYSATDRICNKLSSNHMFVDNGFIYFQDGGKICRTSIFDFKTAIIAQCNLVNDSMYHNTFIVLNNELYYYDTDISSTIALNLHTWESRIISPCVYCYHQFTNNGLLIFKVEDFYKRNETVQNRIHYDSVGSLVNFSLYEGHFAPDKTIPILIDGEEIQDTAYFIYGDYVLMHNLADGYYLKRI